MLVPLVGRRKASFR